MIGNCPPEMQRRALRPQAALRRSSRHGERPDYNPPKQLFRTRAAVAEQQDDADEAITSIHMCTEQCADKYMSTIACYVTKPDVSAQPAKLPSRVKADDPSTKPPGIPAPRNRKEAVESPWWEGYHQAEMAEMKSHEANVPGS